MSLWRPSHEEDEEFVRRSRQAALPIAYALFFSVVALFLWACWQLSERFLA